MVSKLCFRVSVTIEPGRSLLQFLTTNFLIPGNLALSPWKIKNCFLTSDCPNTLTSPLCANISNHCVKIIYFLSFLSLVYVSFYIKLKETNEETGLFLGFTQRKLEWVAHNTKVPKCLPSTGKNKTNIS